MRPQTLRTRPAKPSPASVPLSNARRSALIERAEPTCRAQTNRSRRPLPAGDDDQIPQQAHCSRSPTDGRRHPGKRSSPNSKQATARSDRRAPDPQRDVVCRRKVSAASGSLAVVSHQSDRTPPSGRLHSSGSGVAEPDPDASYVAEDVLCQPPFLSDDGMGFVRWWEPLWRGPVARDRVRRVAWWRPRRRWGLLRSGW